MRYLARALVGILAGSLTAQTPSQPRLSDYSGTYVEEPGRTLEIVAGYEESGKFHHRVPLRVTPDSAALARPRPQPRSVVRNEPVRFAV
jgi:hypothetical protein